MVHKLLFTTFPQFHNTQTFFNILGTFIKMAAITCAPSPERLLVAKEDLLEPPKKKEEPKQEEHDDDDEDDDKEEARA